jgi:hypothetical protein
LDGLVLVLAVILNPRAKKRARLAGVKEIPQVVMVMVMVGIMADM